MAELSHDTFSIMSYLKIFFRRKELIVIPTFIGLVLGICAGIMLPKQYMSSTVILVEEGKTDNPLFNNLAVSTTVKQRLDTIKESMLGWNSLVTLVKRLNLDSDIKTQKQFEQLILRIRKDIAIRLRSNNIIYLSYVGDDPTTTQAVVKNITDIFIERNKLIQDQETEDAISFIEEQLRVYKGKIMSAEIAKLQDQLNELLMDSTEKHPMVKQLREQIINKKQELEEENLEYTEAERLAMESTSQIIDSIRNALNAMESPGPVAAQGDTNKDLYKVMLIDKLDNVMARDVKVNEQIYNVLLQKLETAKITQRLQSSKKGTRYTILDPPRLPLEPFKPNKALVACIGIIVGLLLGTGLVITGEFLDKSFIDVEDAKNYLGAPLLGAISKINTEDSLRHEHEKARWMYSVTFMLGILVIIVTLTLYNVIK